MYVICFILLSFLPPTFSYFSYFGNCQWQSQSHIQIIKLETDQSSSQKILFFWWNPETVVWRCSVEKVFLEISENSETLAQVISCEFFKSSKNIFFYRTPPVAASVNLYGKKILYYAILTKSLSHSYSSHLLQNTSGGSFCKSLWKENTVLCYTNQISVTLLFITFNRFH